MEYQSRPNGWGWVEVGPACHCRDRYRHMAKTLGFEGHIAWAEAMP
jgi:hypothetical protein